MLRKLSIVVAAACCIAGGARAAAPLPALNIDKSQTSVSGISSGGYMAVQLHVAYSSLFRKGAAVIAGGPYNCAENSVFNGIGRCLGKSAIPVDDLVKLTKQWAGDGVIDPASNLAASRAYLFSGANDSVVNPASTPHSPRTTRPSCRLRMLFTRKMWRPSTRSSPTTSAAPARPKPHRLSITAALTWPVNCCNTCTVRWHHARAVHLRAA